MLGSRSWAALMSTQSKTSCKGWVVLNLHGSLVAQRPGNFSQAHNMNPGTGADTSWCDSEGSRRTGNIRITSSAHKVQRESHAGLLDIIACVDAVGGTCLLFSKENSLNWIPRCR